MPGTDDTHETHPKPVEIIARTEAGSIALTPGAEETAVDHGIEESFPASDPVSVSITKVLMASDDAPPSRDHASDQPAGPGGREPSVAAPPLNPGDEAAPGTPGTGETFCPACGGSGQLDGGSCQTCGGTGQVTVGIGGA